MPGVSEPAREIPVAEAVDVVVVGGSTGAVTAAVSAAQSGAKVFLAAPWGYLGEDMTASLRLWLEEGETPASGLAAQVFNDDTDPANLPHPNALRYQYQADRPAASRHADTVPPSRLCDQAWESAARDGLQFDGDVTITLDLGRPCEVETLRVRSFDRGEKGGFRVESLAVSRSEDRVRWTEPDVVRPEGPASNEIIRMDIPLGSRFRYLRIFFKKPENSPRMLLGEVEVIGPVPEAVKRALGRKPWPRPLHVKRTLDDALLAAGVPFLFHCRVTDVLRDEQGRLGGIVMANRAGRQAVLARTVIDATSRATVARLAGAPFRPFPGGTQVFKRVVIGGEAQSGPGISWRRIEPPFIGPFPNKAGTQSGMFPIIEYTLELPVAGDSDGAWAAADQLARTRTYHPEQQFTSDELFQVPPDPMRGQTPGEGTWRGVNALPLGAFRPQGMERLLVLGGCADLPRDQAERLLRPLALMAMGERIGLEAAREAKTVPETGKVALRGEPLPGKPVASGEVAEPLGGLRPGAARLPGVAQQDRALPVLGSYDVVVIGGGTAGAPAGIAAARQGARTLVVEQFCGLGGVGTLGAISIYCSGNRVGFTAEVEGNPSWVIEQRMEWWRKTLLRAGADLWFSCTGCGAFVDRGQVRGAVVVTPRGRGVVLAKVVIDATGNADVAAAAGAPCVTTGATEFAMQGTGLPGRQLGATYTNTDYTYTDETDLVDVWHLLVYAKHKFPGAFDLGQLIDTRERRRIVGDCTLTVFDQLTQRTFPDSIALAIAGYDTHGYIVDPNLLLRHPWGRLTSYVPYRCLLPQGLEGLLVTGIALSAHRDAQPVVRMQPDIQNQGYAAGAAAALAVRSGVTPRNIDIRALQRHLVETGNLPPSVLTDQDSHPVSKEAVAEAVKNVDRDSRSLAIVLGCPDESLPLLREAYGSAQGRAKAVCAKALGMLGDAVGLPTLVAELETAGGWDATPSWRLDKSDPQYGLAGWVTSHQDNTLMALGQTRSPEAVPAVLKRLAMLRPDTAFSHHRAVYRALESLGDGRAAKPLAELLRQPGMGGYAVAAMAPGTSTGKTRMVATRELMLARALYRCGDWEGAGEKTLRQYAADLRGHFVRHAQAVLDAGKEYRAAF